MSAYDTFKSAILGNPFDASKKPSRQGAVQGFKELQDRVESIELTSVLGYSNYADTVAGIAATSDGESFTVFSTDFLNIYLNDAETALLQGQIPLKNFIEDFMSDVDSTSKLNLWPDTAFNFIRSVNDKIDGISAFSSGHVNGAWVSGASDASAINPYGDGAWKKGAGGINGLPLGFMCGLGDLQAGQTVSAAIIAKITPNTSIPIYARFYTDGGSTVGAQLYQGPFTSDDDGNVILKAENLAIPATATRLSMQIYEDNAYCYSLYVLEGQTISDFPPARMTKEEIVNFSKTFITLNSTKPVKELFPDPLFSQIRKNDNPIFGVYNNGEWVHGSQDSNAKHSVSDGAWKIDVGGAILGFQHLFKDMEADGIKIQVGDKLSAAASVKSSGNIGVYFRFLSAKNNPTGPQYGGQVAGSGDWEIVSSEDMTVPTGAVGFMIFFDATSVPGYVRSISEVASESATAYPSFEIQKVKKIPAIYGIHNLKSTMAKRARVGELKGGFFGDSWTNTGIRLFKPVSERFELETGISAPGYVSANSDVSAPFNANRSFTGGWTPVRNHLDDPDGGFGPDGAHTVSSGVGGTIVFGVYPSGVTKSYKVHYLRKPGGGVINCNIDGGAVTAIDTDGTLGYQTSEILGNGDLTITVTDAGSTNVTLMGVEILNETMGSTVLHKLGNGGADAQRFVNIPESYFQTAISSLNLDFMAITLSVNDKSYSTSLVTFYDNLHEIVRRARAVNPRMDIILIGPGDSGQTGVPYDIKHYNKMMFELCETYNFAYVDLMQHMGEYYDANQRGLYSDIYHPNEFGGEVIGRAIFRLFKNILN